MESRPTPFSGRGETATSVPFHDHAFIEILDADPGTGRARIPDAPELKNHLGTVHGGVLFALGEVAAAAGVTRLLGADMARLRAITRRGSIEYLKPARGAISGEGFVSVSREAIFEALDAGPSLAVPVSVTLTDEAGICVARLDIEWFVGRPRLQSPSGAAP